MVYFIEDGYGNVKIGYTKDSTIDNRLKSLQTSNASKLKVLFIIKDGSMSLEKELHDAFAADRIRSEWFHKSDYIIPFIRAKSVKKRNMVLGESKKRNLEHFKKNNLIYEIKEKRRYLKKLTHKTVKELKEELTAVSLAVIKTKLDILLAGKRLPKPYTYEVGTLHNILLQIQEVVDTYKKEKREVKEILNNEKIIISLLSSNVSSLSISLFYDLFMINKDRLDRETNRLFVETLERTFKGKTIFISDTTWETLYGKTERRVSFYKLEVDYIEVSWRSNRTRQNGASPNWVYVHSDQGKYLLDSDKLFFIDNVNLQNTVNQITEVTVRRSIKKADKFLQSWGHPPSNLPEFFEKGIFAVNDFYDEEENKYSVPEHFAKQKEIRAFPL